MRPVKHFYLNILFSLLSSSLGQAFSQEHLQIVNQQLDQIEANIALPIVTPQNVSPFIPPYTQSPAKKPYLNLEIAPEISTIRYREPSVKVKETGTMTGINGIFTFHPPVGDFLYDEIANVYRFEGRFSYGKVNYNGSTQNADGSTTPANFKGIDDYIVEIRPLIGKDFDFNNQSIQLTPYFGGGYRSLFDTLSEFKPAGYNRHIQYFYAPIGADITTKLHQGWSLGANMEYDIFIQGFVTSYLGEIGLADVTNTQKSGYGMRGSMKFIYNEGRVNFIIEPYVRYWHIHTSNVGQSTPFFFNGQEYVFLGEEPDNNSLEFGGKLGIEF